jgi:hypothetical protein
VSLGDLFGGLPNLTCAAELKFLLPRANCLSKELKYNEPLESKPIARSESLLAIMFRSGTRYTHSLAELASATSQVARQ